MLEFGGLYESVDGIGSVERGTESESSSNTQNINFASARADTNYEIFIRSIGAIPASVLISNKTTTGFTVTRFNPVSLLYASFEWLCIDST